MPARRRLRPVAVEPGGLLIGSSRQVDRDRTDRLHRLSSINDDRHRAAGTRDRRHYAAWSGHSPRHAVQIVSLLARSGRPLTVGEIVAAVPVSQSTVSEHLRQLAAVSFVLAENHGTSRLYRINSEMRRVLPPRACRSRHGQAITVTGRNRPLRHPEDDGISQPDPRPRADPLGGERALLAPRPGRSGRPGRRDHHRLRPQTFAAGASARPDTPTPTD